MARSLSCRRLFTRLRDTSGGSLVEAALITPLLLLLTFGIMEFATMFYVYLALENGVSQATRYGVTGNLKDDPMNPGTPLNRVQSIRLAMRLRLSLTRAMFPHWRRTTFGPDRSAA